MESLAKLAEAVRERQEEDGARYAESFREVFKQAQSEALASGAQDLVNALANPASDTAQAAYAETVKKVQSTFEEGQKSALSDYLNSAQSMMQDAQEECRQYYAQYVRELKAALSSAQEEDLTPGKLAAIGQAMTGIAALASSIVPQEVRVESKSA